jgi:AcrR family transcriptional regulator
MNKNSFNFASVKPRDDKKVEVIYKATLLLVKEYGLSGITMNMIAKEAKLATGTVYVYFTNKEELIINLFNICANNYAQSYFINVAPEADFKKNFKKIWMNIANHNIRFFDQMIFLEQCFHSPFISDEIRGIAKEKFKPWYNFIERGKKEKLIKDLDTVWLLIYVRGTIREMVKQSNYSSKKLSPAIMEKMFGLCWGGISN